METKKKQKHNSILVLFQYIYQTFDLLNSNFSMSTISHFYLSIIK
jgi:hypothetical protein